MTRRRRRLCLTILAALTVIAGSCARQSEVAIEPNEAAPTETPDSVTATESPGSSEATGEPAPEPTLTPAPAPERAEPTFDGKPDAWDLFTIERPTLSINVATTGTFEDHVGAMFADVAAVILADDRTANFLLLDELSRRSPDVIPDIVLAAAASGAGMLADVFTVIEAHAAAGAAGDFGPESTLYFDVQGESAAGIVELVSPVYDAISRHSQSCWGASASVTRPSGPAARKA